MSSLGFARRIPKRRRTTKTPPQQQVERQLLDLNSFPAFEGAGNGGSLSIQEPASHSGTSGTVVAETSQLLVPPAAAESNIGMNSFAIDVEVIDDDVLIYSSRPLPQARQQSARERPVTVIIDDDSETPAGPTGEGLDEHVNTLLSLGMNPRHSCSRAPNSLVINIEDTPETNILVRIVHCTSPPKAVQALPEPVREVPTELKFSCPVCMNELVDASSTICGHIFCENCIKASIQAQRKCPTCRKKLTLRGFHRLYLPATN
ncbi:E3 ubiquitin-protein ligase complex slx8-rfp subunit slx8-like [Lolium rigidum]|uniref:E3 ubiquitin-protein ligase complex slx8-rfp subunit slx8-like n=1 Tax=Lolium rigidum TaxID=89674 RepID=UPI001F5D58C1|nr:E3 ubiquitin-protein ligase complex slx8-rfp subunit slx8-like [Lolium rigidum]